MTPGTYLVESRVTGWRESEPPRSGQTRSGYGSRIPTGRMVQLDGKRWHRVYVMQWSNLGTAYIRERGERVLLGSIRP